jgi:DNA-binding response OmpR family regulator
MQLTPSITTEQQASGAVLRPPRVLLLEPDTGHAQDIADQLEADEMEVCVASTGAMAASRLRVGSPDVAIVRVELAEASGYTVVERLREHGVIAPHCQVIAISERAEPNDRVRALRKGCVDFLALPLYYPELHARVELALSRTASQAAATRTEAIEVAGGLRLDLTAGEVTVHGQHVVLSQLEMDLLAMLAREPSKIWTKAELLREIWGLSPKAKTRTLDSHACRVRQKLRDAGGDYVHNRWGVGYRLVPFPTT